MEVLEKQKDRRFVVDFPSMNEDGEIIVSSAIIDFIIFYNKHKDKYKKLIKHKGKELTVREIIDFWIEKVGKNERLENYLSDINVIADIYEFSEKYFDKIVSLKTNSEKQIFYKTAFRTEEQAVILKDIFTKHAGHPTVRRIKSFLDRHQLDADHITYDYAERIIDTCKREHVIR